MFRVLLPMPNLSNKLPASNTDEKSAVWSAERRRPSPEANMDDSGSTKHGRRLLGSLGTPGRKAEQAAAKSEDPLREIRRSIDEVPRSHDSPPPPLPLPNPCARPCLRSPLHPRSLLHPQGEVDTADLRISHRRPSVTGDTEGGDLVVVPGRPLPAGGRLVQVELKVAHEGWLTKQSKTGLPNWNRRCPPPAAHCPLPTAHCPLPAARCPPPTARCPARWFILIGGTLYYSKPDRSYMNFAEVCQPAVEP